MPFRLFPLTLMVVAISILSVACGSTKKASTGPASGSLVCPPLSGGPTGLAPLPSTSQLAYQHTELTAFIHFGMATFDGTEQGNMSVDQPSLFNPTNLDATTVAEWVSALKAAGIGQAMLVAKHSTGFCLWPTATTEFLRQKQPLAGRPGRRRQALHGRHARGRAQSRALSRALGPVAPELEGRLPRLLQGSAHRASDQLWSNPRD